MIKMMTQLKLSHCNSTKKILVSFLLISVLLQSAKQGSKAFPFSLVGALSPGNHHNDLNYGWKRIGSPAFPYKIKHCDELGSTFLADAKNPQSIDNHPSLQNVAFRGNSPIVESGLMSGAVNACAEKSTKDTSTSDVPKNITHKKNEQLQVVSLVDIAWLKAHEEVESDKKVHNLCKATLEWNAYRLPLLVDSASGAILDGHHRYHVGRMLRLSRVPAILVDYLNDEQISVDVWPECGLDCLTKEEVIEMSLSDNLFPPKTSKHDFVSTFASIHVPLDKLR